MKCPLRLRSQKRPLGEATFGVPEFIDDFDLCIEDGCAWYDMDHKCCVIIHLCAMKESSIGLNVDKKQ